jgi:hypothetical protein
VEIGVLAACSVVVAILPPVVLAAEPPENLHCWTDHDGRVLSISDSHGVLAGCGVQYPHWDTDAWAGRTSTDGIDDLEARLRPRHRIVVYDLGTNDPVIRRGEQRRALLHAITRIGSRELFLVTVKRLDGVPYAGVNRVIRRFDDMRENVQVIEWARRVGDNEFGPDHVHLTAAGYEHRTRVIKAAVRSFQSR